MGAYKISIAKNLSDLEKRVNKYMGEGWKPQGGLLLDSDGYYYQALVQHPNPQK